MLQEDYRSENFGLTFPYALKRQEATLHAHTMLQDAIVVEVAKNLPLYKIFERELMAIEHPLISMTKHIEETLGIRMPRVSIKNGQPEGFVLRATGYGVDASFGPVITLKMPHLCVGGSSYLYGIPPTLTERVLSAIIFQMTSHLRTGTVLSSYISDTPHTYLRGVTVSFLEQAVMQ